MRQDVQNQPQRVDYHGLPHGTSTDTALKGKRPSSKPYMMIPRAQTSTSKDRSSAVTAVQAARRRSPVCDKSNHCGLQAIALAKNLWSPKDPHSHKCETKAVQEETMRMHAAEVIAKALSLGLSLALAQCHGSWSQPQRTIAAVPPPALQCLRSAPEAQPLRHVNTATT